MDGCKNNPEKSCTAKAREHIPSDFSMSKTSSSRDIKIGVTYAEVKIAKNVLWILKKARKEDK